MWELTIRNLRANKRRVAMTALAVLLGVAFIGATTILGATVKQSLTAGAGDFYSKAAADIRGAEVGATSDRAPVPTALADDLQGIDGVSDVIALDLEPVTVVKSDGKVMPLPVTAGTWFDSDIQPLKIVQGRAPQARGEAVLTSGLADDTGYRIGDTITFESRLGPATAAVVGIAESDSSAAAGVASLVLSAEDHTVLLPAGETTQLVVVGDDVDLGAVKAAAAASGPPLDVRSGADAAKDAIDAAESSASAISVTFSVFGALSLFVGVFIIYNTFTILMAQRRREMALLRAIGVRRQQVVRTVLAEASVIGLVAGGLGAALGVAIAVAGRSFLLAGIEGPLVVSVGGLITGVVIGVSTTVSSAWLPARRASRVAPVEALRDSVTDSSSTSRRRLIGGIVLAALCALLLVAGLRPDADQAAQIVGLAAFIGLIALIVLAPVLAPPLVTAFGFPVRLLRGQVGNLATENAKRQPQRTAATATALVLGVAIIGFALVIASSLKASVSTAIADRVSAQYVVAPITFGTSLSPGAIAAAEQGAGSAPTSLSWSVPATVDGDDTTVLALDTATGGQLWDFRPQGEGLASLGRDGILVDRHAAADHGWAVGDRIDVAFPSGQTRTFELRATGDTRPFGSDFVIDSDGITELAPTALASQLLIGKGASREQLETALAGFPNAEVTTPSEMAHEINSSIDLLLQVLFGFLALSVIIAFMGVANTLALSIHERTRELGILRAIALRRSHVRSAVRWEAAIISAFGTMLGIVFGAGFGVALATVLQDTGFARLDIPWLQLALVVLGAAAAGALAAALPARRAAKLNVLDAIHQN